RIRASEDLVSTRQSWTCRAAKQCLTTKFVPALSWAVCRGGERQGLRPNKKPRLVSHRGFRGPGVGLHGGTNLDDAWPHQRECRGTSSLAGPANFISGRDVPKRRSPDKPGFSTRALSRSRSTANVRSTALG